MTLKDLLDVATAHTIKVKNIDNRKIIFDGPQQSEELGLALRDYSFYNVTSVRPISSGYGRNNVKTKLSIEITANI
jgi:hypothetical protein